MKIKNLFQLTLAALFAAPALAGAVVLNIEFSGEITRLTSAPPPFADIGAGDGVTGAFRIDTGVEHSTLDGVAVSSYFTTFLQNGGPFADGWIEVEGHRFATTDYGQRVTQQVGVSRQQQVTGEVLSGYQVSSVSRAAVQDAGHGMNLGLVLVSGGLVFPDTGLVQQFLWRADQQSATDVALVSLNYTNSDLIGDWRPVMFDAGLTSVQMSVVPLPPALLLFASGLAGLLGLRSRRPPAVVRGRRSARTGC